MKTLGKLEVLVDQEPLLAGVRGAALGADPREAPWVRLVPSGPDPCTRGMKLPLAAFDLCLSPRSFIATILAASAMSSIGITILGGPDRTATEPIKRGLLVGGSSYR